MYDKTISRPDQPSSNSCAAIIVAAGSGVRAASTSKLTTLKDSPFEHDDSGHNDLRLNNFGNDLPKQFWR